MKLSTYDRNKSDICDDEIFYQQPRFVHHLSDSFRNRLTSLYSEYLLNHHIILDLMSSWVSHLPSNISYKKVIGHGMNEAELSSNERLDNFFVQNLNKKQNMPIEDSSIDVGLIVAGWQYLQYPEKVSLELSRVIKSDSLLIISFTNRAFWTKAPNIWTYSSEEKRIEYVTSVLTSNGWRIEKILNERTQDKKLFGFYSSESDPFFSVIARNNKSNY
ncbi:SAM-dependent methyltransferase [Prochlorococcus marinus XMU1403]|uniref:methyltransferase domain-containing protein n=1 Tax=Prochlorococcus marinus TaxID=1219 RepID=UPI000D9B815D|nr:methyltransferase domain-containing protein [Prochlorococcus marinus]MBW3049409.1 SAM-dependent methyltransferase [Prochlorococcus marinus str. MU1403]PYE02361.1 SAM-dependent methyltransferase [Prochlorococcus marinus XMU1403]